MMKVFFCPSGTEIGEKYVVVGVVSIAPPLPPPRFRGTLGQWSKQLYHAFIMRYNPPFPFTSSFPAKRDNPPPPHPHPFLAEDVNHWSNGLGIQTHQEHTRPPSPPPPLPPHYVSQLGDKASNSAERRKGESVVAQALRTGTPRITRVRVFSDHSSYRSQTTTRSPTFDRLSFGLNQVQVCAWCWFYCAVHSAKCIVYIVELCSSWLDWYTGILAADAVSIAVYTG